MRFLVPSADERQHLGRFYASTFLMEATHLAMPFQVLLIVTYLDLPAVGRVLFIEQLVSLLMEVPTGAWADRFGRKRCVMAGHVVGAIGWLLVPPATLLESQDYRLAAVSAAFGLIGAGAALISGAKEAWVVDNLKTAGRRDLAIRFFGRERSLASAGGICADLIVLALAAIVDLRLFWIATGLGEFVSMVFLWKSPEHPITTGETATERHEPEIAADTGDDEEDELEEFDEPHVTMREAIVIGFASILRRPALLAFTLMLVWSTAAFGVASEAFQGALSADHLVVLGFAGLELGVDVIGVFAPLLAFWLAERLGARPILAAMIALPALAAVTLWIEPGIGYIAAIYLFAISASSIFHTVADDYQHQLLSSATRATASSAINLVVTLAELGSAAWLAVLFDSLSPTTAIAMMGLAALPSVLFLVPKFRTTEAIP